jgi:RNA polymerase sigma factor (sigma-70 family)
VGPPATRDEDWFTGVYARHYPDIVRYGLRRVADPEAAAELAQEVFVVAWRRRAEVPESCLPWLYGVARRVLANRWRARRTGPDLVPLPDGGLVAAAADPGVEASVGVHDVRRALAGLAGADQEILRLIGWEELTVAEAAQVLGCTRATAAVRLHRARRRLTRALDRPPVPRPAPVQL